MQVLEITPLPGLKMMATANFLPPIRNYNQLLDGALSVYASRCRWGRRYGCCCLHLTIGMALFPGIKTLMVSGNFSAKLEITTTWLVMLAVQFTQQM